MAYLWLRVSNDFGASHYGIQTIKMGFNHAWMLVTFLYRGLHHYRNEILFFGFYRCVNSGESLTNWIKPGEWFAGVYTSIKTKKLNFIPYNSNFPTKQHICKRLLTKFQILKPTEEKQFITAVYERSGSHLKNSVSSNFVLLNND